MDDGSTLGPIRLNKRLRQLEPRKFGMAVRFDDSLEALCRTIVSALGPHALKEGLILRDFSGRLSFLSATALPDVLLDSLDAALRAALGPYARQDRLIGQPTDAGVPQLLNDPSILDLNIIGSPV